jgi:hypothetical protein
MEHLRPDALVIRLPHGDSITLVSRVRLLGADQGGTVPIVAIGTELVTEGVAADAQLLEPIDPWNLCRLVARFVVRDD